jgi:hypothetical protein
MAVVEHPGMEQPMLLIRFPGGWQLSVEFTGVAPEDNQPRLGAWLELHAGNPEAVLRAALDAGFQRVEIQVIRITSWPRPARSCDRVCELNVSAGRLGSQ